MDRLRRTDRSMIRWMLKVRLKDRTPAASLLAKLDLLPIETLVQQSRLRWYGHVQRSSDWINNVTKFEVEGTSSRSLTQENRGSNSQAGYGLLGY